MARFCPLNSFELFDYLNAAILMVATTSPISRVLTLCSLLCTPSSRGATTMNQLTVLQMLNVLNRHRFKAFVVWLLLVAAFLLWPRTFSSEGKIYVQLGRIATEISPSSGSALNVLSIGAARETPQQIVNKIENRPTDLVLTEAEDAGAVAGLSQLEAKRAANKNRLSRMNEAAVKADQLQRDIDIYPIAHRTRVPNLSVVSSRQGSDQDVIKHSFTNFSNSFDIHASEFGSVLFDLPVANHPTAYYVIASHLDGVMLTIESSQIEPRLVKRFRHQLDVRGVPIVGLVVNKS